MMPSGHPHQATSDRLGVDPSRHAWVACLPLAHVGGLSVVTRALLTGTPLTVLPGFDADAVEALGRAEKATHLSLVPAALRRLDPALFTRILLGGSRPPGDLPANVVVTYGMTETGSGVVYDGVPLDDVESPSPISTTATMMCWRRERRGRQGEARAKARHTPAGPHAPALLPRRFDGARPRVLTVRRPGLPRVTPDTSTRTARCRSPGGSRR